MGSYNGHKFIEKLSLYMANFMPASDRSWYGSGKHYFVECSNCDKVGMAHDKLDRRFLDYSCIQQ